VDHGVSLLTRDHDFRAFAETAGLRLVVTSKETWVGSIPWPCRGAKAELVLLHYCAGDGALLFSLDIDGGLNEGVRTFFKGMKGRVPICVMKLAGLLSCSEKGMCGHSALNFPSRLVLLLVYPTKLADQMARGNA
jgi:hypothetical protein